MSTPPKRNDALASDDEENTPAKRIRFALPPTKVAGAPSIDGGGVTLAVGNVQPISCSTLDEVIDTMPHRDWIAIEMGVSDDARAVLSNLPLNACEGMDEPATDAQIGLYNVLLKQSGLNGFLPPTELATAKQSMQRMSTVLQEFMDRMKGIVHMRVYGITYYLHVLLTVQVSLYPHTRSGCYAK